VDQRPAVIVMAAAEDDIVQAVNVARERQMGIAVQATGHGVATPANGGMLINTATMRQVKIDATHRTATVAAGAIWGDVLPKAQEAGLAALSGSSSGVGVVGYTSGGGSGWLGRKYGFAADHVLSARVVTANGRVVRTSASENPDLFWAIRGGTSNFGIVSELEFRLFPDSHIYGGGIYWPIERASEVADVYREFAASAPETVSSRLALVHLPPLPQIPEALRGRWLVAVQSAFTGPEHEGAALFAPFRKLGGVMEDALKMMPMGAVDAIARDPRDPVPGVVHTELLNEISPEIVRYLVEDVAQPRSQVVMIEM